MALTIFALNRAARKFNALYLSN